METADALNAHGEVPDCGPPWACANFGGTGHDYQSCPDCKAEFDRQIATKRATLPREKSDKVKMITVVMLPEQFIIQVAGVDGTVKETWRKADADGAFDCAAGNFEDEELLGNHGALVNALSDLAYIAADIVASIN